ncbi:hypothetical protein GCM10023328_36050 [Modestobacter marinus]|uniref:Uncharacterized protein n=1 Tax=Modestobacter marinus TaxID=477641 RepID=A0A846LNE9_9ACTN|nr:hypothetical protein [Modestobacter marinus]NIH69473.1 hypothetical protein [Modestobacter marinus]GGL74123.1 hypothetical protein GCM10011589_32740 [Modestobacter marinus]
MASLASHRVHAVISTLVDGLTVGGAEAALDLPPRSAARFRVYSALMLTVAADAVAHDLPSLRRTFRGMPVESASPADRAVTRHQALATTGWGLAATAVHGPLARALRRRGHPRPHLLVGIVVGVGTAATTLPVRWRRATERAVEDLAAAQLDAELAQLLDQPID